MTEPTDLQLIEHYVKLRDIVTTKTKALTEALKPYKAGMETIETALMARLIQRGADNTKTEAGTAYKVEHMNIKVLDREKFLDYALNGGEEMLLASPQKDAVRQYLDVHKANPPGVEVSFFADINVRKS
jgi:hypothetical protein